MDETVALNALRIARWFIVSDAKLKRTAMWLGGVDEVVNQAMIGVLKRFEALGNYKLSTVVVNNVSWSMADMVEKKVRHEKYLTESKLARYDYYEDDPADSACSNEVKSIVRSKVSLLPDREYAIVVERMGGATLQTVAISHRVTRERIRQIEQRSWRDLRKSLEHIGSDL